MEKDAAILNELQAIIDNHQNCIEDYNAVLNNYSYKKMSIGVDIYGMYYPEHKLEKYFTYKGKLTNNEKRKDYAYFFDNDDRLILTERYAEGCLLNIILFYHYENKIEIVWYCTQRKIISKVAEITYHDNILSKFIESGDVGRKLDTFKEYTFDADDEYVLEYGYHRSGTGKEYKYKSKMKK